MKNNIISIIFLAVITPLLTSCLGGFLEPKEDFTKFIEGLENVIRFAETGEMTEDSQIIDDGDFSFDIDSIFDESELKNI